MFEANGNRILISRGDTGVYTPSLPKKIRRTSKRLALTVNIAKSEIINAPSKPDLVGAVMCVWRMNYCG